MQVSQLQDGECLRVPLNILVDAPWGNVRREERSKAKFEELKGSIKQRGVVQSIAVRPNDEENTLEVLAGYGRRDASAEVGEVDIPAVIMRVDDKEGMAIGLAENLQREDLSIVDEIRIAQQYVSAFDADYEEAAKAIGWSEKLLKGRLKLNDCAEPVLDALAKGLIKIGHAEVLCQFTATLQDNTLAKILEDGWTVEFLKERANKASRLLRHAKFDTTECQGCPHNSSVQASLFENHIGGAKCGNLLCYREKSDAWVAARKQELEEEEGAVFLSVEKPPSDRNEVSENVVGKVPFTEDCLPCVSRVRILQDGINRDCGTVLENQCINLSCFKSKVKAKQAAEQAATQPKQAKVTKKAAARKTTAKKPTLSTAMREQARTFARQAVGAELLKQDTYRLAMTLVGIADLTGYAPQGKPLCGRSTDIARLASLSKDELEREIDSALRHGTTEGDQNSGRFNGTETVLESAKHVADALTIVVKAWQPTKEWLSSYQKGAIEGFCKQRGIGFAASFDNDKGKGEFAKLMKQKKADIIKAILAFDFDWSEVAPKELRELVS